LNILETRINKIPISFNNLFQLSPWVFSTSALLTNLIINMNVLFSICLQHQSQVAPSLLCVKCILFLNKLTDNYSQILKNLFKEKKIKSTKRRKRPMIMIMVVWSGNGNNACLMQLEPPSTARLVVTSLSYVYMVKLCPAIKIYHSFVHALLSKTSFPRCNRSANDKPTIQLLFQISRISVVINPPLHWVLNMITICQVNKYWGEKITLL
jgi:hypothetical protein